MPMTRYEVRNEYSLADPDLYTAADKDDPEALLEGIAMAGLVGLLRQLGDLAEFAGEIFHELHEEVMVTAARGHNLMIRVQQLEDEVPSIEKAFLSQTDHSSFLYNAGVDWHLYLRMDHNLITQGDLPRFIMDSYEECRGPPRLFLLDRFDVAGAGACLKRYTDPSFFKVETSFTKMNGTDIQREKKIRKAKKKGPHWRNGGTPEVLPTSHAKLHQLFMEEHVGNGKSNPERRVKLKRRLNGFPFDVKTGKSYMEKLLKTPSPEHKVLHEVTVSSSPLILSTNDHNDSSLEVLQVRPVSPDRETVERKGSSPSSPDRKDIMQKPFIYEPNGVSTDKISKEDNSCASIAKDDVSYTCDWVTSEKDIAVDGERNTKGRLIGYQSDDIASEIDNYVDAPMIMESEMDTDSELRTKSDFTSYIKRQPTIYDANANEEQLHFHSSDSQSTGNSMVSDDENNSSKKEMPSFLSSYFPSASADNKKSEHYISADIPEIENIDTSSSQKTVHEDVLVTQHPKSAVSDDACSGTTAITNHRPDFEQLTSVWRHTDSDPILAAFDSGVVLREVILRGPESDEKSSISDEEVKKTNLAIDPTCSPSFSDSESLSGDSIAVKSSDFLQEDDSDQEDLRVPERDEKSFILNEEKKAMTIDPACSFSVSDSESQLGGNSPCSSAGGNLVHKSNSKNENLNLGENIASMSNSCNDLLPNKNDTLQMISSENPVTDKLGDEDLKLPENCVFDYPDMAHSGDCFMSAFPKEEKLIHELDNEDRNTFSDASNDFSCFMEASLGKEFKKTASGNAQTVDAEDHYSNKSVDNQVASQNLILLHVECSQDWPGTVLDAHDGDGGVIPDEETTVIETPKSCEVVGLQVTGISNDVSSNDSAALESSRCTPENFDWPAGTSHTVEKDGITPCTSPNGQGARKLSVSPDLISLNEVNVQLDEPDSGTDQSEIVVVAATVPAVADNVDQDYVCSPLGDKLVEEGIPCFEELGRDKLENGKNCLSGSHSELGIVKEVGQRGVAPSDLDRVFCNTINYNHPMPEVSDTISNSVVEHCLDFVNTTTIQSSSERIGSYTEHKSYQQSDHINHVVHASDAEETRLQVYTEQKFYQQGDHTNHVVHASDAEETTLQEQTDLQPNHLSQEVLYSGEINRELLPLLNIYDQQRLGLDDHQVASNSASKCSLVNCPNLPLMSDLPVQSNHEIDISGHSKYPLGSMFRSSNYLLEENEINLEESPPMPPLPPVQWRMGKVQHASPTTETDTIQHKEFFSQGISTPFTSTSEVSSLHEELKPSLIQIVHDIASKEEKIEHSYSSLEANVMMHEIVDLPPKIENDLQELIVLPSEIGFTSPEGEDGIQIAPNIASRKEEVEHSSTSLEASVMMHETVDHKKKTENEKQDLIVPSSEIETLLAVEDGIANGSQTRKLPRPRNPLIDAVAALDKSKLRKVTERVRPEIQKVDERDSLLEQIRTKSFNLKPALATRPSIQGPKTSLKVSAILEKANAIRQALAGSDEDDEDSWSDS